MPQITVIRNIINVEQHTIIMSIIMGLIGPVILCNMITVFVIKSSMIEDICNELKMYDYIRYMTFGNITSILIIDYSIRSKYRYITYLMPFINTVYGCTVLFNYNCIEDLSYTFIHIISCINILVNYLIICFLTGLFTFFIV
jgi:hypothetical protein